jgi:hypothetical protein
MSPENRPEIDKAQKATASAGWPLDAFLHDDKWLAVSIRIFEAAMDTTYQHKLYNPNVQKAE